MHTFQKITVSSGSAAGVSKGQALFLDASVGNVGINSSDANFAGGTDIAFLGIAVQDAAIGEECYFCPPGGEIECLLLNDTGAETWNGGDLIYMDTSNGVLTKTHTAAPTDNLRLIARVSLARDAEGNFISAGDGEYGHCRVLDGHIVVVDPTP